MSGRNVAARTSASVGLILAILTALLLVPASVQAADSPSFPLRTQGNKIVDAGGRDVVFQGVNWFGLETSNHAPHGLWTRDYKAMLAQIKSLGFNTVRLPFSLQALRSNSTSGIDYGGGRNALLQGKTPQQVMDIIIDEAAAQGLMIILDNHSQADDGFMFDLWYGQNGFTENDWVDTWTALAQRYRNRPNVVAFDLKNEPHGSATWGTGNANDWRRAAERAGAAIQAIHPDVLIIVEGIEGPVAGGQQLDRHWWGGNLEGVRNHPVRLPVANRLVYSPHEYGPGVYAQPWFSDPAMASILADRWHKGFGYIHEQGIAPIFVGEFGAKNVGLDTVEGRWIRQFADYLGRTGMSWTFWSWNPNSGDTGGVLKDDWTTVHADKMALLAALQRREAIPYVGGSTPSPTPTPTLTPSPTPTPTATPTPTPTATPTPSPTGSGTATALVITDSVWNGGWCGRLAVSNTGTQSIRITSVGATLPSNATVTSLWNGTATRSGSTLTVTTPTWAKADAGATYSDTGLCISGTAPTAPVWSGPTSPTPTPTPTPTVTPSPSQTTTPTPTVTPTPSPSPTATVTPTPTPTSTPTPTPSPTPGGPRAVAQPTQATLSASLRTDSQWPTGYCQTAIIRNTSTVNATSWTLTFDLPSGHTISQSWSGTATRSGNTVTVRPASWGAAIAAGQTRSDFGFCVTR